MSIAQRLVNLSDGLSAEGILSAAKGGTGTTTGAGSSTPTISAIGYGGDDTATNPAGGATITLTGTNFASGAKVLINTTPVGVVTVVSATQITFTAPANAAGSYILYVVNLDGSTAIAVPGIQYSGTPAWSTAAGTLGTGYETSAVSTTVSATSDSAVTYSVVSGTLPSGVNINTSGTISGTSPLVGGSTTYTFTVRATDAENQDTDRQFSLTINPDVVSWSSANTVSLPQNVASTTTLLATSAAGQTVSYSVDTLPAGLTLSGATVSGTATTAGTTTTVATATAAVTGKSAQRTITWTVSIASDTYFPYTTLLLNGETSVVPFLADASTNNFALTAFGDTKPSNFNPYTPGYYSNYFNNGFPYLRTNANSAFNFGTGDFTLEFWYYSVSIGGDARFISNDAYTGSGIDISYESGANRISWYIGSTSYNTATLPASNRWHHIAYSRTGTTLYVYVDGIRVNTYSNFTANITSTSNLTIGGYVNGSATLDGGYLSNVRLVKGVSVYSTGANFTPSTEPLTAVSGTSLLTCQSNRLIDASANAFAITRNGDVKVSSFDPFQPSSSYSTYGSTYFDGTGDYLSVGDQTAFEFGSGDYTIELWWFATTSADQNLIGKWDGVGSEWILQWRNAGYFRWAMGGNVISDATVSLPLNIWNHIVVSKSGTSLRIFLNGTQINTTATEGAISATGASLTIATAQLNSSPLYTTGYISNLRIVKGTAVYVANFTPPTTPLTAVAGTSLLTLQTHQPTNNSQFVDNSTLSGPITRNGNTTQGSFSPYGASWSNYFGSSTSDNIYAASNAKFAIGTGNFTVEAFVNFSAPSSTGRIFLQGVSGTDGLTIVKNSSTSLEIGISGGYITYTWTPNIGQWYHIAVVRSGTGTGQVALYIDGQVVTTGTSAASIAQNPVFIGGLNWAAGYNFPGYISNVRYSNIARTITVPTAPYQADANTLLLTCQSPNFVDNSHNAFTITNSGTPSTQKFSPFSLVTQTPLTHSVYFDGSGDNLSYTGGTTTTLSGDFTLETWVNLNNLSASQPIICIGDGYNLGALFFVDSTGKMRLYANNVQVFTGTITVAANTWTHISFVRSGSTITGYVNGVAGGTVTNSSQWSGTTTYIGRETYNTGAGVELAGYLSNLRLVKGTALYTSNFTVPTTPLTAVSGTSLLTCQDAVVRDNSSNKFTLTAAGNTTPRQQNPFGHTTSSAQDYTPSVFGSSAYFDGSDGINLPTVTYPKATSWTIEAWVYTIAGTNTQTLVNFYPHTTIGISLNRTGAGDTYVYIGNGGSWLGLPAISSSANYKNNAWNHVALVRDGSNLNLYHNGTKVGTSTTLPSGFTSASAATLGQIVQGSEYLTGYMADFRLVDGQAIYTSNFVPPSAPLQAVPNTTLLLNMDKAAIQDKSGKAVLETLGDIKVSTAQKKYGSSSLYFDGTGDYLTFPSNAQYAFGSGDFTVECWVNSADVSSSQKGFLQTSDVVGGLSTGYTTGITILFGARQNGAGAASLNGAIISNIAGTYIGSSTAVITANTWTHITLVRINGTAYMYVNGTQVGSGAAAGNCSGTNLVVGGYYSTGYLYAGYLDDLRITKGYARYTANFTPPSSALLTK
jgi:hypothetical protein